MIEKTAKWSRGMLWVLSLAAVLCSGCPAFAQQTVVKGGQLAEKEDVVDQGLVQAYDLQGDRLWKFATKGQVEVVVVGSDPLVFVSATAYKGFWLFGQ